jgi:hypothetical protein
MLYYLHMLHNVKGYEEKIMYSGVERVGRREVKVCPIIHLEKMRETKFIKYNSQCPTTCMQHESQMVILS